MNFGFFGKERKPVRPDGTFVADVRPPVGDSISLAKFTRGFWQNEQLGCGFVEVSFTGSLFVFDSKPSRPAQYQLLGLRTVNLE